MIRKITRGWQTGGLIRYLMGPGRYNEHTNQHVVAIWDGDPARNHPRPIGDGKFDSSALIADLIDPAVAAGLPQREPARGADGKVPRGPVWHCSLRNHLVDRVLTDVEWAEVVEEVMHRTGIAPRGDVGACRWVAIRHAEDHVHIAAVLVRQDNGRRVHPYNDYRRVGEVCRQAERRHGLTPTAPDDRTALTAPTRAEMEKATRRGAVETSREWLRRASRVAAAASHDETSYYEALKGLGVLVAWRRTKSGRLLGYALAAPKDVNVDGQPIWFAGSTLAPDLSLPKLRARWVSSPVTRPRGESAEPNQTDVGADAGPDVETVVSEALEAIEQATSELAAVNTAASKPAGPVRPVAVEEPAAGIVHATEDMLIAVTETTAGPNTPRAARGGPADAYQRAALEPRVGQPRRWGPVASRLRSAARDLMMLRSLAGYPGSGATTGELLVAIAALLAEVAAYHEARRAAQARAADASRRLVLARPAGHPRQPGGPPGRGPEPGRARTARPHTRRQPDTRAAPPPKTETRPDPYRPPGPRRRR